jgi:2-C-methyl-D-erythritol 4-phosphate cytidylyltransferase/2-C-methyl-D-erythritol 2,4-cyclodiphosphate synthase
MYVTAILAAGGRGQRFGGALPKQLVALGAQSALERSVSVFVTHPAIDEIVVALPDDIAADPPPYLRSASKRLLVVAGGPRRQDSVNRAFQVTSPRSDIIVVHDAVRPFVTAALISHTIAAAAESGAAVAALRARDTVKRGESRTRLTAPGTREITDPAMVVAETLPRESIFLAQTPQAFRRNVLRDALALADEDATDEASLAERAGHAVRLVEGEPRNIKITTREDLLLAEAIARDDEQRTESSTPVARVEDRDLAERPRSWGVPVVRIGAGYDLHRLVEGRPLVLGGVTIPSDRGLLGHSDADAVCHAVTDAVLGAAAAGDIGRMFPDTDPQWTGASSVGLLSRAAALVRGCGYDIRNVDVVVIAERPKIAPFVELMRAGLANALGIRVDEVSIKGKTNEGIGELGRGEAIAVHAVALLERRN